MAQKNLSKKHQFGIDVTNTLTFLKKNTQSTLFNYRYTFENKRISLRSGLNLDLSEGESEGKFYTLRLGFQRNHIEQKWNHYFGADLNCTYFKNNANPVTTITYGISPLFGVEYFFNEHLSLSTEGAVNFNYYTSTNEYTFDLNKTTDYFRIYLGYVGMMIIHYHF
jgi:hypothetical protein